MGCCCSSDPVENAPSNPDGLKGSSKQGLLNNQNNRTGLANMNNRDSKTRFESDSSKTINDDTRPFKIKPAGSTISENNQFNEEEDYIYADIQSYNSEDEYNLAGYKFEKRIGRGGSAEVVQMSKDNVSYAVKIIDLTLNFKANYLQNDHEPTEEVAILKRFDHVHVVKFVDFIDDTDNDKLFIVMELLSGGTIMECKTLEEKREAFTEALSAVQYIHYQRIAHQDIKPANILRADDGTIKLVDFGAAVFVSEGVKKISSGLTGTTVFSPPEKFTESMYDPFTGDVWSLGATLYNLLYDKPPFSGPNIFQLQQSIINDEPEFPEDADFDAVDLIKKMLKKNPDDRITCNQIWDHPFLGSTPTTSSMRSLLDSSSRIFESLKSMDAMNSMTRISRGSLRSSLKGSLTKAIVKQAKKLNEKNKHKLPQRFSQKPQSQLIKAPKVKLNKDFKPKINLGQRADSPRKQKSDSNDNDINGKPMINDNDLNEKPITNELNLIEVEEVSEPSLNDTGPPSIIIQKTKVSINQNIEDTKKPNDTNINIISKINTANKAKEQESNHPRIDSSRKSKQESTRTSKELAKKDQKPEINQNQKIDNSRKQKNGSTVATPVNKSRKDINRNEQSLKQINNQEPIQKVESLRKSKPEITPIQKGSPRKQKVENSNAENNQKQDMSKKGKVENKEIRTSASKQSKTRRQSKPIIPK
ncbi:hypothetical protein M9Y10_044038 [Tritrichomonas musculus]|uniref:Protein kinase domain-containing protein n=1 Tax=Tritrichomonas musculus TaxID=1915356 RepID=A0ABR2K4C3_9EUKA